ncbi:MAG: ATP-dependent DNA helicase RecG, partial [Syntrophomonadaceae bacterium]|nr:ATP-dependent DNA helicase RecG [Syntrophomonadaceae bacterium]
DGFEIARHDLQLRGPGDLWGVRQHGLPHLRIADLASDATLLASAREDLVRGRALDPAAGGQVGELAGLMFPEVLVQ